MTREQVLSLQAGEEEGLEITQLNFTFAAFGDEAANEILELSEGYDMVAGVFPAHVAVALAARDYKPLIAMPVSVPAPAKEGAIRNSGFVHHHWEYV
jgi:hypothetical protein